jgi:hypothetical protein
MLAADNLSIEARAPRDVAHGNTEMGNGLDRNHVTLPRARPQSLSTGPIYLLRVVDTFQKADVMCGQSVGSCAVAQQLDVTKRRLAIDLVARRRRQMGIASNVSI